MVFLLTTTATTFDSFVKWPAEQTYINQLARVSVYNVPADLFQVPYFVINNILDTL